LHDHLEDTLQVMDFELDADDIRHIDEVASKGRDLQPFLGMCGDESRPCVPIARRR
jgi:diketogulonate reductase-like aldo/keto reductase